MKNWIRRLRGLFGLGAGGAIVGSVVGTVFAAASSGFGFFNHFGTAGSSALLFALFGGVSSIAVGLSIPAISRSERVSDLSPIALGLIGLLAGAAAPLALVVAIRGTMAVAGIGFVAAITGVFGGALTAGMVAMAGRAERQELEPGPGPEGLIGSGGPGVGTAR